jgi:hypothetical protein
VISELPKDSSVLGRFLFALLSPACLLLAFFLPSKVGEYLLLAVWGGGGVCAIALLAVYAYTDKVSHRIKEATLCFLLGNLLVFFVLLLKPT